MNEKELSFKVENYNPDQDMNGKQGGNYGHILAEDLYKRGYFNLGPLIKKRRNSINHSFPPCIDSSEKEMFEMILRFEKNSCQNQ